MHARLSCPRVAAAAITPSPTLAPVGTMRSPSASVTATVTRARRAWSATSSGAAPPFDPATTAREYAALAREYYCSQVTGDAFSGEWVASAFRDAGIRYETSPLPKSALYLEALPVFNRGAVSIPDHPTLVRELRGLERRVHRSGKDSVDQGAHGSDDFANAVCGAMYVSLYETRRPRMRMGAIGVDGVIHWHDEEPRQCIRFVIVRVDRDGHEIKP
jgi:hypothetical protein